MSLRYPVAASGLVAMFRAEGVEAEGVPGTGVPLGTIAHGAPACGPVAWLPPHAASHSTKVASSLRMDGPLKPRSLLDGSGQLGGDADCRDLRVVFGAIQDFFGVLHMC